MSEESDEFSYAQSSDNFTEEEGEVPSTASQLFVVNNASDLFSIEGPTETVKSNSSFSEAGDNDEFYDVLEYDSPEEDDEKEKNFNGVMDEYLKPKEEQSSHNEQEPSHRIQKRFTMLEFLQEEDEAEVKEGKDYEKEEEGIVEGLNRKETVFEFLNSYEDVKSLERESKSSLSQLQSELQSDMKNSDNNFENQDKLEDDNLRRSILNLPKQTGIIGVPPPPLPRRRESILKRANPLASFFVDDPTATGGASDSDSMISELTEAFTTRTDLTETRLSRAPSSLTMLSSLDYLKLAKRYKPVPVKTKSKQKSEFASLLLIQELNRSSQRNEVGGSPTNLSDSSKAIFVLKFSPDGQFLAAAGAEGIIKIWSLLQVDTEAVPRLAAIFESEPVQILRGHSAEILDCAWSTNNFLLSASMDKTVRLWHHSRPDALGVFQHLDYVTSVAFHPRDPRIFLSGSLDCKLRLWSIQDRSILHWNELPPGNFITAVAFTRSGIVAIAGTSGGTALIFDTERLRYNTQILVRSSRSKSVGKKITSIESVPGNYDQDERVSQEDFSLFILFYSILFS